MSRDMMRGLKAKIEEEARLQKVKQIVYNIYNYAVQVAKTKTDTSYNYQLPRLQTRTGDTTIDAFYTQNMPDILAGLQELFLGCDVSHTLLCKGTDGKMYDISKLDEKVLPFINRDLDQSYIVIDWS